MPKLTKKQLAAEAEALAGEQGNAEGGKIEALDFTTLAQGLVVVANAAATVAQDAALGAALEAQAASNDPPALVPVDKDQPQPVWRIVGPHGTVLRQHTDAGTIAAWHGGFPGTTIDTVIAQPAPVEPLPADAPALDRAVQALQIIQSGKPYAIVGFLKALGLPVNSSRHGAQKRLARYALAVLKLDASL